MKRRIARSRGRGGAGLLLGAAAMFAVSDLTAQDLTGTWVLSVDLGATGSGDATFVLVQEGTRLSGTYSGALGELDVRGSVDGDQVALRFEMDEVGVVTYSGTVTGTAMEGTCEYGELGGGTFRGVKKP